MFCKTDGTWARTSFKTCQSRSFDKHAITNLHALVNDIYVGNVLKPIDDWFVNEFPERELRFLLRVVSGC